MLYSAMLTLLVACLVLLPQSCLSSTGTNPTEPERCDWGADTVVKPPMSAVVLGGTGAIGHHIVQQLLSSNQWTDVITIGRREVPLPANQPGTHKLKQMVVNMDNLQTEAAGAFQGADAVFCALGTTRGDAGSAEQFKKVDHDYVAAAASAAKAGGVPYFGLVTAQGANANIPANDWKLFHGLLYAKTKGLAEEAVKSQGFSRTAIFRPGMLDRGDMQRATEKMFSPVISAIMGNIHVADVAKVMIADAAAFKAGRVTGTEIFEMKALKQAAATVAAS